MKSVRKDRRLTLRELAKRCGATVSGLAQIERGEIQRPRSDTLYAIARALDVDAEYLYSGKGPKPEKSRPLSSAARELAEVFDSLASSQQEEILVRIRAIREQNREIYEAMRRSGNLED